MPTSGLSELFDVRPAEGPAVAWSFVYFFCLLSSYYMLRPIRDEMGVTAGIDQMHWLFTGTFVAMAALVPLFGWLTTRFRRRDFLRYIYLFFIVNILVFYLLFASTATVRPVAAAFFIWLSVFNLFVVSVFWSFMADLYRDEQARRLFGVIAAGGTLGAIVGPAATASLVGPLGINRLLLLSALLLGAAVLCIGRLIAWQDAADRDTAAATGRPGDHDAALGGGLLDGLLLIARSPYLIGIGGLMLLFTTLSTFLYFQQAEIVKASFDDSATRTTVFAAIDLAVNSLTLLLQTLLTGRLVKALGLAATLALIPLLLGLGFTALAWMPVLVVLIVVQVVRRAGNYAIMRPAREMLYVVLRREEKYKAKNVIDTLVYRGGDALSAWVYAGLRSVGLGLSAVAWIAVPLCAGWALLAFALGRQQRALASRLRSD